MKPPFNPGCALCVNTSDSCVHSCWMHEASYVTSVSADQQQETEQALDRLKPGDAITVLVQRHAFEIGTTFQHAMHSGRRLYRVYCLSCRSEIHEATTGPWCRVEQHIRGVRA